MTHVYILKKHCNLKKEKGHKYTGINNANQDSSNCLQNSSSQAQLQRRLAANDYLDPLNLLLMIYPQKDVFYQKIHCCIILLHNTVHQVQ